MEKQIHRKIVRDSIFMSIMIIFAVWFAVRNTMNQSCTIMTIAKDDIVLFANNEDWHSPELLIGFYPASDAGFGSVEVGFRHSDGSIEFGGAVNEKGLAWDINSLPTSALNPHPEKPYSYETDNYFDTISRKAKSVEEAIQIAQEFDFGESMSMQIHVADATGDAVVISAGPDNELAFTRKGRGEGYLVSTNFNLANPDNGTRGWRFETATSMLEKMGGNERVIDYTGSVLEAVHLSNLTTYTMYSYIFDLRNRKIYLYYMAQYNERIELDISDELAKGQRIIEMKELFSQSTVETGDAAYKRFELRFTGAKIAFVLAVLIIAVALSAFVMQKSRKGKLPKSSGE